MKSSFIAFAFVLTALVSFGDGQVVIWDNYGTGGWRSGSQWVGGKKPVAGDTARLIDVSVSVTQTDWDYVKTLAKIQPGENATLTFELTENAEDDLQIQLLAETARFVKKNAAKLRLTNSGYGVYGPGVVSVENGTLTLDVFAENSLKNKDYPLFEVKAPGVLDLPVNDNVYCRGLVGDGTVTRADNPSGNYQLVFMGDGNTYDFSGTIATNVALTAGQESASYSDHPARQVFSGTNNGYVPGLRFYNGFLGVASFGDGETPSSLGYGTTDLTFVGTGDGKDVGWLYCGPDDVTVSPGRNFRFDFKGTAAEAVFDIGSAKGVRFENTWRNRSRSAFNGKVASIVLTGSNTEACVVAGTLQDENSKDYPNRNMRFTKRGSGVWRFGDSPNHTFRGPVFVERGRLEYESIAETNEICSLGYGTVFSTNSVAVTDDIPYIHRIGDGRNDTAVADLATFAYVGTSDVDCRTRPVALWGAGRMTSGDVARFGWKGFLATPEGGTLVLDGDARATFKDDRVTGLCDGEGVLSVEKRGTGTWRIVGTNDFSGTVSVKEGSLIVEGDHASYSWFRFSVLDYLIGGGTEFPKIQEIALYDDKGVRRNTGLTVARKEVSRTDSNIVYETVDAPDALLPGTAAYGREGSYRAGFTKGKTPEDDDRDLAKAFDDSNAGNGANGWYVNKVPDGSTTIPDGTDANALQVVMRLADAAPRIAAYDICAGSSMYPRYFIGQWRLEGSLDGVHWEALTNVTFATDTTNMTDAYRSKFAHKWYSRHEQEWWGDALEPGRTLSADDPGFPVRGQTQTTGLHAFENVKWVSVAPGAKLIANGEVTIKGLSVDHAVGTGVIDGFAFAETGTINVENVTGREAAFDVDVTNCTDFANVGNWQVAINGQVRSAWTATATADGHVTVKAGGLLMIVK